MKQLRRLRSFTSSAPKRFARVNGLVCRADLRVIAIPGALRKASTNNGLLRAAAQVVPDGLHVVQADISQLPLYNDDLWASGIPDSVAKFREQINSADALLFSVPEYNYSLPGPMKNAIDWASKNPNVFAGKPATMLGQYMVSEPWRACLAMQLQPTTLIQAGMFCACSHCMCTQHMG